MLEHLVIRFTSFTSTESGNANFKTGKVQSKYGHYVTTKMLHKSIQVLTILIMIKNILTK